MGLFAQILTRYPPAHRYPPAQALSRRAPPLQVADVGCRSFAHHRLRQSSCQVMKGKVALIQPELSGDYGSRTPLPNDPFVTLDTEGPAHRHRPRPQDKGRPQARHLRRTRRRPRLDPLLRNGSSRLRVLLPLQGSDRLVSSRTGRFGLNRHKPQKSAISPERRSRTRLSAPYVRTIFCQSPY
jgi:hypothetical protein